MMYQVLSVPIAIAAFAGGYYANVAPSVYPHTPDLAERAQAPMQAAMARDVGVVNDANEALIIEPEEAGSRHIARSSDGLFYVHAMVNGQRVRFLVDTGASVVVLSAADARAVGAMPASGGYNARMSTAGGSRPMAWTKLGHVRIAGHDVRGVTAAVVNGGPGVSLLGQNLLSKLGGLHIDGDRLEFERADTID
ncbi:TIGR02281 family clan AA aspartic protease [Sphingomonas sp.]|uniref:retropepsin-like aspartic protease family protein n=1 Tax=Sphingomonas sp. TaxID=28214 RepID=UPI000DB4BE7C|nr:TIGR02281 family clan AA aspartic protease [Sphingomonas sp.]PZU09151.1 MAG: TIGR02281 family clan AA aspartic protease [Sphingomonas sp.]